MYRTALARPSISCKLQIRPLVREDTLQLSDNNKRLVTDSRSVPDTKTDWPTGRRSEQFLLRLQNLGSSRLAPEEWKLLLLDF
jgi:hypothetical protein